MVPPMAMSALRRATDTVDPTTCSMIAVSAVNRLAISLGLFSSKKEGASVSRLLCTLMRKSATTRSPSQDTK